jgi:hypothetical protein
MKFLVIGSGGREHALVWKLVLTLVGVALFLTMPARSLAASPAAKSGDDFYTQVARQKFGERVKGAMEKPAPAKLSETILQWNGGTSVAPLDKLDTPEELNAALAELRMQMKPFLQELQPRLAATRISFPVEKMQFRLETDADRADFNHTLQGRGAWQEVAIPHYTGPGEQAVCWYRTTFTVTQEMMDKGRQAVCFNGVEYFADVFVNGHCVGSHEGYFAPFDCDFTPYAKPGENILLVRVRNSSRFTVGSSLTGETSNRSNNIPRTFGDKLQSSNTPGWDDPHYGWNCTPNGFGIGQGVSIEARAERFIGDIFPRPIVNAKEKVVEVAVEIENPSEQNGAVVLKASVHGRNFKQMVVENVHFKHGGSISGRMGQREGSDAKAKAGVPICKVTGTRPIYRVKIPIPDAKLWTPDEPWLYQVQVTLEDADGKVLDTRERQFGMRSFEQRLDSTPIGRFYLNGQEIRLRGANEMGNYQLDVLRRDWPRLVDDILLAKLTHMNFIRCTQTVMPPEFYDYCDRLGLLAQSDLPLFSKLSAKKATEAIKQAGEMARVVRAHPCNCVVSFFNEPDRGDGTGGHAFALTRPQVEEFFKAATIAVKLENPDQVIKLVDGDYNPPSAGQPDNHCYSGWYGDHCVSQELLHNGHWCSVLKGWMVGCGEFGCEGLDSVETMLKLYPKEWVTPRPDGAWTPDKIEGSQTWGKHREWYATPRTMDEWVKLSQIHQANAMKLKTEAFRRMPRMNTFAIHLFIDAWPNGWLKTIMDVQRQPKRAWFAYRDALAPIAVQVRTPWDSNAPKLSIANCETWSYQQNTFTAGVPANVELWVCNDTAQTPECELRYQLEVAGQVVRTGHLDAQLPTVTDGSRFQGFLPVEAPEVAAPTSFRLRVSLISKQNGNIIDQYVFDGWMLPKSKPAK